MAPLSLKIILEQGAVTRKVKFDHKTSVRDAHAIVKEKVIVPDPSKEYALFLRSADDDSTGIWLEPQHSLDYYMLKDGDCLDYICKVRNLRVKLLDGSVKTLQVDEWKAVSELMIGICGRLGITNHDEYGLCPEEEERTEDLKEQPQTGTLTMKRKHQPKDKGDVALQQLSRKLNTDDNVEWLDQHRTLREQGIDSTSTVILKRRLFYSDRNVDSRDPVQLNLLYVQTRDAILNGRHLVTEEQAAAFAGIQCQIHFEDFQEEKHKPGFFENLNEYLPSAYVSSWGIEKKLLKEYRKHQGLAPLEAKNLYIKTARDLPTYGVTFFLVKEKQKDKKKLVPRLLGINAEAILRLDENTKEILQQWPLTHVKTYHVGKSETFTLDFGDYSDKDYCCKTQDAFRIRDILEGYIDLIRRRMLAKPQACAGESMAVCHDNVQMGQSHIIQHGSYQPTKVVKETFVGPSRIMAYDQGSTAQQGTQMMTMQQIIETNQINNPQKALKGEVAQRGDMSVDCVRKLKRMNSNSVKIVTLLTDPTDKNVADTQKLVTGMQEDLVVVEKGVKATADQQTIEESKKMLLDEMQDLNNYMSKLSDNTLPGHIDAREAKDAAEKIADLTTEMYFSQDPKTRRRSELLNRSKNSFIAGEKLDATIRRASFIAANAATNSGIDNAAHILGEAYKGPVPDDEEARRLESVLRDRMGKLNAALALYLTSHADPNNIDYAAAINSMNAINELMPKLARDAQMLAGAKDPVSRKELLDDMQTLCQGTKKLCSLTGTEDHDKLQEASNKYADIAGKLIFTFARGKNADKENEIIELAKDAGDKTTLLLMKANELTKQASKEEGVGEVDTAGVKCAEAARDLLACAQLTAPAIHEPHCQSALTASVEGLSSSLHHLGAAWKPMVEQPGRHAMGDELHHREMDVHKALERLRDAYGNLDVGGLDDSLPLQEKQRLKFIYSLSAAKNNLDGLEKQWGKMAASGKPAGKGAGMPAGVMSELRETEARRRAPDQLAQLNAALAALAQATADHDKPDYATAELALNTISELMPQIVKDMEVLSLGQDPATRAAMQQHVNAMCEASRELLNNAEHLDGLGEAASKFSAASGKLVFLISPGADKAKQKMVNNLAAQAYDNASGLLSHVFALKDKVPGDVAAELQAKGAASECAARALVTTAQVTAPSIDDARCSDALASAVDNLRGCSNELTASCNPHLKPGSQEYEDLEDSRQQLHKSLDKLAQFCQLDRMECDEPVPDLQKNNKKVQFVMSMGDAKRKLHDAAKVLDTINPLACTMMRESDAAIVKQNLSDRMAQLNAAVAALTAATTDRENPDYEAAQQAMETITTIMPEFVQDACMFSGTMDENGQQALLKQLQQLCDATQAICDNASDPQGLNDAVVKFSNASNPLTLTLNPKVDQEKEKQIIDLSSASCVRASELLSQVQGLSQRLAGAPGHALDARGTRTANAAQALLTTAQVTAATISSPACSSAMVSAAEHLRGSARELTGSCQPHLQHGPQKKQMDASQKLLENCLDDLVKACKDGPSGPPGYLTPEQKEKRRLQFVNSMSGAKSCFEDAQKQLKQPVVGGKLRQEDVVTLQHGLSDRMAQLNAAIAALTAATADRENPDYATAQEAINTITTLMPEIVQDSKALSSTKDGAAQKKLLDEVQRLCDASKLACEDVGKGQGLSEAAAKFSDASKKLMFTITPTTNQAKQKQIIDQSSDSCVRASELLSQVQALTQQLDGPIASELDSKGASTADAAQALLSVAQVTAPSISSPQCREVLASAVQNLRDSSADMTNSCTPHVKSESQRKQLENSQKGLEDSLDKLLKTCGMRVVLSPQQQEKRRLQFVNSLSNVDHCFNDAQKLLRQPVVGSKVRQEDVATLQYGLSDRMAQLNAAIAALTAATADREHPDYATAQQAINTITTLMPEIVQDSKAMSSTKDDAAQKNLLDEVQRLCDASRLVCEDVGKGQGLSEAAAKFSDASKKLMFTITPTTNQAKQKQIIDQSSDSCVRASELLSQVQALTQQLDGPIASELDSKGASTADAAQALLSVAQLTAPSVSSPQCREVLASAVQNLRESSNDMTSSCIPHIKSEKQKIQLENSQKELEDSLDKILKTCGMRVVLSPQQQEKRRLQFVNSLSNSDHCFSNAQNLLQQSVPESKLRQVDVAAVQHHLLDKMAQLNAAIAALTAATADREHPDYTTAQQAINTINRLMPEIVQDSKILGTFKDGAAQKKLLDEVQQLCDASKRVCEDVRQGQGLSEATAKFSDASKMLMFTITPTTEQGKQKQIIDQSSDSCVRASELLSQVQALTQQLDGPIASELDSKGASTADAAQALLSVAQVTAPSISSAQCRNVLASAVQNLRGSSNDMTSSCIPHVKSEKQKVQLENGQKELENSLDKLLKTCGMRVVLSPQQQEKRRLQFVNSLLNADHGFNHAQDLLQQPAPAGKLRQEDVATVQHDLSNRMAQLNAAIAALTAATADREHPDYTTAQQAINTITTLMPEIVQDSKILSTSKDGAAQKKLLDEVQQLCNASKHICEDARQGQGLSEATAKFSDASKKLMFTIIPTSEQDKQKQIIDQSSDSCVRASELLSQVQALTQQLDGPIASELDSKGASTADAAQALLSVAQVTAPSIRSPQCRNVLASAVQNLRGSSNDMTSSCIPYVKSEKQKVQLQNSQKELEDSLDKLLKTCGMRVVLSPQEQEKRRLQFINSLSNTDNCFGHAQNLLKSPSPGGKLRQEDVATVQHDLSDRMAQLNAAIAALTAATADREHPDYTTAQQAINTITTLMPKIVQDSKILSTSKDGAAQIKLLDELQQLCNASKHICEDAIQGQGLSEAAAKFSDASKKLMFTITPTTEQGKQKQIIDQSSVSCVRASELLSQVQALTQQLDGPIASELDSKGASTADAAQALLSVAQVTAPSISSPQCRDVLASAVQNLRGSSNDMTSSCIPHVKSEKQKVQLENGQKELEDSLDKLLKTCGMRVVLSPQEQEKRRLQFINSLSNTDHCFGHAQNLLQSPSPGGKLRQEDVATVQHDLSDRMAQLNAAIAALTAATADREHPDYTTAQQAINTITTLMPEIVQDSKVLSTSKEGASQKKLLDEVQQLCNASKDVCEEARRGQALSEAAAKFCESSKKLMFTITPTIDQDKQKHIIDQSSDSCVRASELLSQVQALTQQLDGPIASELDSKGASTADAAQALLSVAQVTATSITSPQCREVLASAVQTLRESSNNMTSSCTPFVKNTTQMKQLENSQKDLEDSLDKLLKTCGIRVVLSPQQQETQRLQFANSLSNADNCFQDMQKLLTQPVTEGKLRQEDVATLQHDLSNRVAQLNAAIASLAAATADRSHPDFATAQSAVDTIRTILPAVVQQAKTLSSNNDVAAQQLMQQVQQLCDATKDICHNAGGDKGLTESAAKFSDASNKLMFTVTPTADLKKQKQIIELSSDSCVRASELLSQVQALTQQLDGPIASELDSNGASTADAAQALLSVAQVTSSSLSSPQCRSELISAAQTLRSSAADLTHACTPHVKVGGQEKQLKDSQVQLNASLDRLLQACIDGHGGGMLVSPEQREKQRVKFMHSVSTVSTHLDEAQKQLEKPLVCSSLSQPDSSVIQNQLCRHLALLNAAVAALTSATMDHKHPDYPTAERSIITITELMPVVVQESQTLSCSKDDDSQMLIQQSLKELCDSSRKICDNADDPKKLNEAALTLAMTSNKLLDIVRTEEDGTQGAKGKGPAVPVRSKPAVPARRSSTTVTKAVPSRNSLATQDFLEALRNEESQARMAEEAKHLAQSRTDEDKCARNEYCGVVDNLQKHLQSAKEDLQKLYGARHISVPGMDAIEIVGKERSMEDTLAKAGVHVAALVSANYSDKLDYKAAMEPTVALTKAVTSAVDDGGMVSSILYSDTRKDFIQNMMGLCDATSAICEAAKNDKTKLNDAAIAFGNQSSKLLRVVSAGVNPALEKEVILRAKSIGDSASRLALEASNVANSANATGDDKDSQTHVQDICKAGAQCVDAAGKLVYTSKLVAPTMHHFTCQEAILSSAETLSSKLTTFSNTWKPLPSDPHTKKLAEEAMNLERQLEKLKNDVKNGHLGKRRVEPQIVLNTPLKQMSVQIMENAKSISEHSDLPSDVKEEYKKYCGSLEDALRALDLANARCQRAPHDKNRRNELEIASQDLQMITLQSRPAKAGQQQNNIVDFRDFLQGLVTESEVLQKTADKNQAAIGKRVIDDIKLLCTKINEDATRLMDPSQVAGHDSIDDIEDIDQFGQECVTLTKELSATIRSVPDQKARTALHARLLTVIENCHLLRYATNSALAMARSAALDAALNDLDDFESTVIHPLVNHVKEKEDRKEPAPPPSARLSCSAAPLAVLRASARAGRGRPQQLRQATANYCMETAVRVEPSYATAVFDNLKTMRETTAQLIEVGCCKASNWSHCTGDDENGDHTRDNHEKRILESITRTQYLLKEQPENQLLKQEDLDKLLSSGYTRVEGTRSQLEDKFSSLCKKVSSMSGSIFPSVKKPESLARSLHATADAAIQLAAVLRSLKDSKKTAQSAKIEDATHEMCLSTYSLLKTSELLSHNPNHHDTRRKLLEACRELNNAISDLNRAVHPSAGVPRECSDVLRCLQLQRAALALPPLPAAAAPYAHCIDALHSQRDVLLKLNSEQAMSREEFLQSMLFITTAVGNSADHAAHASYLLSVSEKNKDAALEGLVDVSKMHKSIATIQDTCVTIVMHPKDEMSEKSKILEKQVEELVKDLDSGAQKTKNSELQLVLKKCKRDVETSAKTLYAAVSQRKPGNTIVSLTFTLSEQVRHVSEVLEHQDLVPTAIDLSSHTQTLCDDVCKHSTALLTNTQDLINEVTQHPEHSNQMKWSTFNKRREVLASFDALLKSIKLNGQHANILEAEAEETEQKSYVQIQTDTAFKWLHKPMAKSDTKANGQQAVRNLIDVGNKMLKDLSGADKEDLRHLVEETEQLLVHCSKKYDQEQYSLLMERIRELQKAIERMAVTRVVEDFMDAEEPLQDLDILADAERDEKNRKFLLERKIAELLAQLGRVNRTARFIADTGNGGKRISSELRTCSDQTELLAPMLVKAAEERIYKPDDKMVIENYRALLAEYTASLAKVRDLCDQSVDPMDFVQTAGETMQRMREESTKDNDPMKCAVTSAAITKLANRVIHVGLSSSSARKDPELQQALTVAKQQLSDATPAPDTRASKMPDWRDTTAKILRATEEVESVLGGENIFKKQPDTNQPIYNEALNLHVAIRDWSSRDNEIVAVAKRMAVLMAKLSDFMNTDKQREVLTTSKSIVTESHEVARLAKKLAHECSDHRIKTNLLQVCERIPTISGQLKMLTTVKGSSLGHHGTQEDKEAMDMLVGNAQSLMISIQDVVKAAASASVKIMSQRGPKIKWVRKTYY